MAFNFINNKLVTDPQIEWMFEGGDTVYKSDPERFDRNVKFWRNKLAIHASVPVKILNGKDVEDAQYEIIEPVKDEPVTYSTPIESNVSESDSQPSVSNDTEGTVNPPKRKSRKKATDM